MLFINNQIKAHQIKAKRAAMNIEKINGNTNPENIDAVNLYMLGFSVTQISDIQGRQKNAISSAILRARRRSPDNLKLQKKYNFVSERTKLNVKTGALTPTITQELSADVQKWILTKTINGGYESIASFFTDLVAEAYFADQK